jgi:acyl carrier protein
MLRDARVLRILEGPTETLYMQLGGAAAPNCGAERILADALALPSLAAELGAAVAAIRARAADARLFAGESAAMQWLDFRIGELCAYALLLGAAERRAQDGQGGAQASAALEWARARFDGVRNAIAAEQDAARAAPSPAVLLERIAAFSEAVGDVDQQLAGEDQEMDSLLRVPDEQGEAAPWPGEPTLPRAGTLPRPAPPAMRQLVRDSVGRWLATEGRRGLAAFADDTPFAELGIDSLAAVPIALDIEHRAGLAVVPELLFDYPTVNALADYLHGRRRAG